MRPGVRYPFDLNSELHPSPSAAIFPLGQAVMEDYADPSGSESLTELNSTSGSWLTDDLVEFPPLESEDLIRLGEDSLHVRLLYYGGWRHYLQKNEDIRSISNMISRSKISPTGLSSEEATALAETFRKVPFPAKSPLSA